MFQICFSFPLALYRYVWGNLIRFFQRAQFNAILYDFCQSAHLQWRLAANPIVSKNKKKCEFRNYYLYTNCTNELYMCSYFTNIELCVCVLCIFYTIRTRSLEFRAYDLDYLLNRQLSMGWKGSSFQWICHYDYYYYFNVLLCVIIWGVL